MFATSRSSEVACNFFEDRDKNDLAQLLDSFEDGLRTRVDPHQAFLFELSVKDGKMSYGFVIHLQRGLISC